MTVKPNSQAARILRALADNQWHTTSAIHRKAGTSRLNSRISELRKPHGYRIEQQRIPGRRGGPTAHRYRLLDVLPRTELERLFGEVAKPRVAIPGENAMPRNMRERFRVYALEHDELRLVATCPDAESVGVAIVTLGREGQFASKSSVGVLDTHGAEEPGEWILNPWDPKEF